MSSGSVRVFICTSHISSVYMTLYARATKAPNNKDVLLVDIGSRRDDVVRLIEEVSKLHNWTLFHSYSDRLPNDHRFEPNLRKRLTRRWKEVPLVRGIYRSLLRKFLKKRDRAYRMQLRALLGPLVEGSSSILLHAHTETYMRGPFLEEFPKADLTFFEHGQGDYIHILRGKEPLGPLRALFAEPYKTFLASRRIPSDWVLPLNVSENFPTLASQLLDLHRRGNTQIIQNDGKPLVYILLEALDMYEVPTAFWGAYIEHIVNALPHPLQFHFILKPHPSQSTLSLKFTDTRCKELGLSYTLMDNIADTSIAAEIDFAQYAANTRHVFCLVSSACFYLSQLYRSTRTEFHYSTEFMEKWIGSAPPQFKRLFAEMKPLIKEVLAERCVPY